MCLARVTGRHHLRRRKGFCLRRRLALTLFCRDPTPSLTWGKEIARVAGLKRPNQLPAKVIGRGPSQLRVPALLLTNYMFLLGGSFRDSWHKG